MVVLTSLQLTARCCRELSCWLLTVFTSLNGTTFTGQDEKLERRVNIKGVLLIVMPEWERDALKAVHIGFCNRQTAELM